MGRDAHGHVQRLDHEPCCGIAVIAAQQLLPQLPPALIREQLSLVAAVQQRPGFGAQAVDQMVQIDAPGAWTMAAVAIDPRELAHPVTAQDNDQTVMVQPDRDLMADQAGRNRVDDLAHLDGAGAAHPHREQVVVGKAKGRQGAQLLQLLLVAPLPGGVEGCEHFSQQLAVFGNLLKITAPAQDQLLLQPPFEMAMGPLDDAVFVGDAAVVTACGQTVVVAERLVPGSDVDGITAVTVAVGC